MILRLARFFPSLHKASFYLFHHKSPVSNRLELELVNLVTSGEAEGGLQVLGEVVNLLDVGKKGGVNGLWANRRVVSSGGSVFHLLHIFRTHLLLGLPVVRQQLLLLVVTEELVLLALLASLGLGEVGVVDGLGNGNSSEVDLGRGGDNVSLTDSSERNSVEPERSANEQKSAVQLLQEDNPLAPESSSQQDQDGTGGDGSSELSGSRGLSGDLGLSDILGLLMSRVRSRSVSQTVKGNAQADPGGRRTG